MKDLKSKKKPTGYIAICQCGAIIGAMDCDRTERRDAGKILGQWLSDGCTVEPKFGGAWNAMISACRCKRINT